MEDNIMEPQEIKAIVSAGFERAKAGEALKVCGELEPILQQTPLPHNCHYAYAWILYYALHQSAQSDITPRKQMLARYFRLEVTRPHKLHSMILTEAIRLYRDAREKAFGKREDEVVKFSIMAFMEIWNASHLRPGDWRRKDVNGQRLPSTVEKLLTVYVDELSEKSQMPPATFQPVIDKARELYADSYNLHAQTAALHIIEGKPEEAGARLRKALLLAPLKFHLWSRLAATVDAAANPRLHIALLQQALASPGQEQFKGRVHLALAQALLKAGQPAYARFELDAVLRIYQANDWHLPAAYRETLAGIPEKTVGADPTPLYRRLSLIAYEEIYRELPTIEVVKTYHKAPDPAKMQNGRGKAVTAWRLTDAAGNNYWVQPHRFGFAPDLPLGSKLAIRAFQGKAVSVEKPL